MIHFILNDKEITTGMHPGTTLLDFIRYQQQLKGTKIGCREGDCGACTILAGEIVHGELRYRSMTSCLMALGNANGKHIVTIEGVNFSNRLNPFQQAMADEGATQCGFCTPGFVMSLAGYCLGGKETTDQNAIASVDGNICRCTGYKSIERAAVSLNKILSERPAGNALDFVTQKNILPDYFKSIRQRLLRLQNHLTADGQTTLSDERVTILGGGTDLYVQKHEQMTETGIRFFIDNPELRMIEREGNRCMIGASTTVTDLMESKIINDYFPSFAKFAKLVSSTPIRNMATISGNFVNASPIGDFTIFFLALNTVLVLNDGKNRREIPLRDFYLGYKQLDKKPGEFVERFYFDLPGQNSHFNFEKVSKRTHLDIASVNAAMLLELDGEKIQRAILSAGGVFAFPKYLEKTSIFLAGKTIRVSIIEQAVEIAQSEISPISDTRGSKEYKRLLLSQLIKAHFEKVFPGINNGNILSLS